MVPPARLITAVAGAFGRSRGAPGAGAGICTGVGRDPGHRPPKFHTVPAGRATAPGQPRDRAVIHHGGRSRSLPRRKSSSAVDHEEPAEATEAASVATTSATSATSATCTELACDPHRQAPKFRTSACGLTGARSADGSTAASRCADHRSRRFGKLVGLFLAEHVLGDEVQDHLAGYRRDPSGPYAAEQRRDTVLGRHPVAAVRLNRGVDG
jgi:hypothetical protein